jgi:hypothetical protein
LGANFVVKVKKLLQNETKRWVSLMKEKRIIFLIVFELGMVLQVKAEDIKFKI